MPSVYIPVDKQRAVIERAEGRCEYCQSMADYATETFAVEHVMPVSRGGTSNLIIWHYRARAAMATNTTKQRRLTPPMEKSFRSSIPDDRNGKRILAGVMILLASSA